MYKQKKAFTMAEVLITLGILGIVIAMTLPSIIKKYRRNVAAVKLEKFYSVMNQALRRSIAEHGEIMIDDTNKVDASNAEYIEMWYKENITKYIQTIHEEGADKYSDYYRVAFIDGSGFNSYMSTSSTQTGQSNLYIFYCLSYKTCELGRYEGENQFLFILDTKKSMITPVYSGGSIQGLKDKCYNENIGYRHGCAALIEANGWKIPDDYPWIK